MTIMKLVLLTLKKVNFGHERNVVVWVFFRTPNTDIQCSIDVAKDIICDKLRNENELCYLLGYYDINLLNVDKLTANFNDTVFSNGFIPLITCPTAVTQSTATFIDNIFANQFTELHNDVYREHSWLIYPITILFFLWMIWSKGKLWQLLFPTGISVIIKTNSCCWLRCNIFSASDTQQLLLFFIVNYLKSILYVSHWKRYLKVIIQENLGYHQFFVIPLKIKINCKMRQFIKKHRNCLRRLLKSTEKKYHSLHLEHMNETEIKKLFSSLSNSQTPLDMTWLVVLY